MVLSRKFDSVTTSYTTAYTHIPHRNNSHSDTCLPAGKEYTGFYGFGKVGKAIAGNVYLVTLVVRGGV